MESVPSNNINDGTTHTNNITHKEILFDIISLGFFILLNIFKIKYSAIFMKLIILF